MRSLKINRLLPKYISTLPLNFGVDIQSQSKVRVRKPKNLIWPPGGHLKVTSLKINRLLPMATINMHMKFEIEIPKQTWLMLRKPCRLQTDGHTDRQTDKVNPVYFVIPMHYPWIILCMHRANERRRYSVNAISHWLAHTQNDPCTNEVMSLSSCSSILNII